MANQRLEKLEEIVKGKRVLILLHNNPGPDAIAAGWALSYLLKKKFAVSSRVVCGGRITRKVGQTLEKHFLKIVGQEKANKKLILK